MSSTPSALLTLGVSLRSAALLKATLEPVGKYGVTGIKYHFQARKVAQKTVDEMNFCLLTTSIETFVPSKMAQFVHVSISSIV